MQGLNFEKNKQIQDHWDGFADRYEKVTDTVQGSITCAVMANAANSSRVLEVGCGPGQHSLILASNFLKKGGVLVSSDFSGAMVKKVKANYERGDYSLVPGNKAVFDHETDYLAFEDAELTKLKNKCDLDAIVQSQGEFRKLVFGCQANNEFLPFPSEWFDCYISNLSIHIVSNPLNQVKEAYRVLQKGSAAVFTVWGSRERSVQFSIVPRAVATVCTPEQKTKLEAMGNERSQFHLWDDKGAQMKEHLEATGFSGIKMWPQAQNVLMRTGEEYFNFMGQGMHKMMTEKLGFSPEQVEASKQAVISMFDQESGADTTDLCTMEIGVFLGFKQ